MNVNWYFRAGVDRFVRRVSRRCVPGSDLPCRVVGGGSARCEARCIFLTPAGGNEAGCRV